MYRQGDILLTPTSLPRGLRMDAAHRSDLVARGEATGHTHRITGDGFVANGSVVIVGPAGARLVHDEHDAIPLAEGVYSIGRQREYEDTGWRQVYD